MEGLTKDDYDYFRSRGFEVIKSSGGKYYIRPYPTTNIDQKVFLDAQITAMECGFVFDSQGDILGFKRKRPDDELHYR